MQTRFIGRLDVSAASGIVCLNQRLYVVADDQLELAVYDLAGMRMQSIALLPGDLPEEHAARKAHKPDFEALAALPDGSLLALGSGSTARRARGVRVQDAQCTVVDLSELYAALARDLPELNIEGATVFGESLYLCSRGNGKLHDNALVQLDLGSGRLTAESIVSIRRVQLPDLDGVPLSLTDLTVHEGELLFSAAAEASANTYDDGACAGSVVGKLSTDGTASVLQPFAAPIKLEGVCSVSAHELYAVADADDPNARAPLYALEL